MTDHPDRPDFMTFYREHYLVEHQHPANVMLHVFGTLLGLALVPVAGTIISPLWLLTFPAVHALPGLLGHRLFERNAVVGDFRLQRTDHPLRWFILANHLLTWRLLTGRTARF